LNQSVEYHLFDDKDGFRLRIRYQSETLGIIEVKQIAFPQYRQQYLNMGLVLAPLCGLVISNARAYQKIAEKEALLQQMASHDVLTGLYNRRHFLELAETEFLRSKRYNRPLSIMAIDIDFFKVVNDTFGHAAGDRVLAEFSQLLISQTRKSDIPARIGGDEFVILLPETGLPFAESLADRLRMQANQMVIEYEGRPIKISISLGITHLNEAISSLESFLHRSDVALYQQKTTAEIKWLQIRSPTDFAFFVYALLISMVILDSNQGTFCWNYLRMLYNAIIT
jgi:diguanylate cyclase (GGDEF)-like protein